MSNERSMKLSYAFFILESRMKNVWGEPVFSQPWPRLEVV